MALGINYAAELLKNAIVKEVNESGLPVCVIRAALENILAEARALEQQQIEAERAEAEKAAADAAKGGE